MALVTHLCQLPEFTLIFLRKAATVPLGSWKMRSRMRSQSYACFSALGRGGMYPSGPYQHPVPFATRVCG